MADPHRRGVLVPAVLRAGQRQRPRQPRHAGRARRRRVRRQRAEDLDERRPVRPASASSSPAPTPTSPKHKGISYFICPMDAPGIEIRPITEMTGGHTFNEVFFTDVRIPAANLVGDANDGWRLAKVTLGNERVSLSTGGVLWGNGPTALDMIDAVRRRRRRSTDPVLRQRLAAGLHRAHAARADPPAHADGPAEGRAAGPGGEHPQDPRRRARPARDGARPRHDRRRPRCSPAATATRGSAPSSGPAPRPRPRPGQAAAATLDHPGWYDGFMFSQALTIGGGTGEVQRNIVAERVLGLPHDVDVQQGLSWCDAAAARGAVTDVVDAGCDGRRGDADVAAPTPTRPSSGAGCRRDGRRARRRRPDADVPCRPAYGGPASTR